MKRDPGTVTSRRDWLAEEAVLRAGVRGGVVVARAIGGGAARRRGEGILAHGAPARGGKRGFDGFHRCCVPLTRVFAHLH